MRERPVSTRCAPLDGPPRGQDGQPVTEFKKDIPCVFNKPVPSPLDIRNSASILKGVKQLTGSRSFRQIKERAGRARKGEKLKNLTKPDKTCNGRTPVTVTKGLTGIPKFEMLRLGSSFYAYCTRKTSESRRETATLLNSANPAYGNRQS